MNSVILVINAKRKTLLWLQFNNSVFSIFHVNNLENEGFMDSVHFISSQLLKNKNVFTIKNDKCLRR